MAAATAEELILTEEEVAKVRSALQLIEEAQHTINYAAQELCSVRGFADEWSGSHAIHDAIKGYWHIVNARLDGLRHRN